MVAVCFVVAPQVVSAQIVSNLAQSTVDNWIAGNVFGTEGGLATAFTTGSNAGGYSLTSATIVAHENQSGSPANIQVTVNSDSSGNPGASLGALTGANPSTIGNHTYTNDGILLAANTTYLLTLLAPGSPGGGANFYSIATTNSDTETTSDVWSIADSGLSTFNGGTSWNVSGSTSLKFSLTATPVPEPHEYALMVGLGLVGFVFLRRRMLANQVA